MKFLFLLFPLFFFSILSGSSELGFSEFLQWVQGSTENDFIFSQIRLPRSLAAVFIGGALGFSGLLLQSTLENPLAEPYTIGISGGASLGVSLALALGIQPEWIFLPLTAGGFAILSSFLLLFVTRKTWDKKTLILLGLMISLFCSALVIFIFSFLDSHELQKAIYWLSGQLGSPRDQWWPLLAILCVLSFVWSCFNAKNLDLLLLGEATAKSLECPTQKVQRTSILIASLLTAMSVAIAGLIAFVGLLAPHIAQISGCKKQHRFLLWQSFFMGSCLLLFSDTLARQLSFASEVPSGSIVALIGAPCLAYLLIRARRLGV